MQLEKKNNDGQDIRIGALVLNNVKFVYGKANVICCASCSHKDEYCKSINGCSNKQIEDAIRDGKCVVMIELVKILNRSCGMLCILDDASGEDMFKIRFDRDSDSGAEFDKTRSANFNLLVDVPDIENAKNLAEKFSDCLKSNVNPIFNAEFMKQYAK